MDSNFWLGIAIGAVLSLLASIVANLLNNRIQATLDKGKRRLSSRRVKKILSKFHIVSDLHNGKRDKLIYFVITSALVGYSIQVSFFTMSFVLYLVNRYPFEGSSNPDEISLAAAWHHSPALLLMVMALILSSFGLLLLTNLFDIAASLGRFEHYKSELKTSHPELELPD